MANSATDWVSLRSADLSIEIDPHGAQLSTLRDRAGRDLLWDGDPAVWSGRAPLLFPIVGALAGGVYRLGTASHPLSRHGFARGKTFATVTSTAATASFTLTADAATLTVYPFPFELNVLFALDGPTLWVTSCIRNLGERPMPASFGYHPAFRWPLPYGHARDAHVIEFADDEPAPIRRLDADGLLSPMPRPTPVKARRLALDDALFKDDVIIFDEPRSRSLTFGAASGPRLRVGFPDARYLGLWSKPAAPFLCIEPWQGVADPIGFTGDFFSKPGVFMVAPGAARPVTMSITLLDG